MNEENGLYLYCVAEGNEEKSLGKIGIETNEVYTIAYRNLCALVHRCPARPYQSKDEEVVKKWVQTHQKVLDIATEKFGNILPSAFDTIIKSNNSATAEGTLKIWLAKEYENLKNKLDKLRGKAEYGVQIFWDPKIMANKVAGKNKEIEKLKEQIKSKPKGTAYMFKYKLEKVLKIEMEREIDRYFKYFYEIIKKCVDNLKVEKVKRGEEGKQMLLNLSCLISKDGYKNLGEELEKINKLDGFSVRFSGPWPPYSFV
ncbi:GvpL/GvpF family gas vesicle protein [Candidatus Aerophobetes bacterium]|nr:GvpL/GvpF family gas vesicle protein [Candidatus Aerophobetes bacterium]